MSGVETGAALLKVSVALLQRAAPTGMALIKSWLRGKEVLVVGPPHVGKTTFVDYLQYGLFEDEKQTGITKDVLHSARFNIRMGRDAALELSIKSVVDVPGQIGPLEQAKKAFDSRPHALLIFADLTQPLRGERAAAKWMQEFCRELEARWRANRKRTNRVKSIIVVMNKCDKAAEQKLTACRTALQKVLTAELREARGQMLEEILIMPCTLVNNPAGAQKVDSVITHLAKALAR